MRRIGEEFVDELFDLVSRGLNKGWMVGGWSNMVWEKRIFDMMGKVKNC